MNADDSPPTPDDAAERFAAAVEGGEAAGTTDPGLARELEVVELLAGQGSSFDPDPETRVRARRRLMAALARADRVADHASDDGPSRAS